MYKNFKKLLTTCMIGCLILTQIIMPGKAAAQSSNILRLSGADRYKTAVAISQKGWKTSNYAVIARGDDFADALCAGPLAQKFGAPILLTQKNKLNADVLTELKRLGVKHVFIAGGTNAVSSNVESALKSAGITKVERLYGADRYETSVKVAEKLGTVDKVVLATGKDFPDALSISAVAAKQGMPILLAKKDSVPEAVNQYLKDKSISKSYVIGGADVLSDTVKNAVPNAIRLGGNNRYETNVCVMEEFASVLNFTDIYVAIGGGPNGNEFADALSGAVLAAQTSSPVVLAYKVLPDVTANFIKEKVSIASRAIALGGEAVVPSSILNSIASYVAQVNIESKYDKEGTYGTTTGTDTISGNVVISVAGVTLQNTVIEGDLLLTEGIGDGNVTLKNVTVKGTTTVRGGGPHSVLMYNFNGQTVVVDVPDGKNVRLVAQGTTKVDSVIMKSNGKLEESDLIGNGFTTVEIPRGIAVTLSGNFDSVSIEGAGANVNVESGKINTLNVLGSASNSNIKIASDASVTTLEAGAPVEVTGTGSITTANIKSDGVTIEQKPTTTNVDKSVGSAIVGGSTITGGTTVTPPVFGGGGGGSSTVSVSDISVTPKTMTLTVGATGTITATVEPANATNKKVNWTTNDEEIATVDENGNVKAIAVGTTTITATSDADSNKKASCEVTVKLTPEEAKAAFLGDLAKAVENITVAKVDIKGDNIAVIFKAPEQGKEEEFVREVQEVAEDIFGAMTKDIEAGTIAFDSGTPIDLKNTSATEIAAELLKGRLDAAKDFLKGEAPIEVSYKAEITVDGVKFNLNGGLKFEVEKVEEPTTVESVSVVDGVDGYTPVTLPKVGQVIRANITLSDGTVIGTYPVDENAEYKWYYKESPDTVLGTEGSYTVTSDNVGKTICVEVTVKGYEGKATWIASGTVAEEAPVEPEAPDKVKFTIVSKDTEVSASVGSDYVAKAIIPKGAKVDASEAKIKLEMTDIASLGIVGTRSHELTIKTGIEGKVEIDLEKFIGSLLGLETSTINGKFGDKNVTYTLSRANTDKDNVWLMTPDTTEAARNAWMYLVNALTVETFEKNDSQIFIPKGAYLTIGNQKLLFEKDLYLQNVTGDLSATEKAIRDAVVLKELNDNEKPAEQVELYMPTGAKLRIGQSQAELSKDIYGKVNGLKLTSDELNAILPNARDAQGVVGMITGSLDILNTMAKGMNGATINLDVQAVEASKIAQ